MPGTTTLIMVPGSAVYVAPFVFVQKVTDLWGFEQKNVSVRTRSSVALKFLVKSTLT